MLKKTHGMSLYGNQDVNDIDKHNLSHTPQRTHTQQALG